MILKLMLAALLLAGSVASDSRAATLLVRPDGSGDVPLIQDAIDACKDGDTVALADGVFRGKGNRDLLFRGKAIVLTGRSGDPTRSVIDCFEPSRGRGTAHRGIDFGPADTAGAVARDLTIRNGTADGL